MFDEGGRECGWTSLHFAAAYNPETIKELLDTKTDVNAVDKHGDTLLHFVAKQGHTEVVKELLKAGADVNTENNDGNTPLLIAIQEGHAAVAAELLKAVVDVNGQNNLLKVVQTTPVEQIAALLKNAMIFKIFVKKLEERARELLESGNILPRLTLSPAKQGVRKWMDENKAVETMQALSINPYTIKSPTQAYKALGLDAKDHVRELDEHITRTYNKRGIDYRVLMAGKKFNNAISILEVAQTTPVEQIAPLLKNAMIFKTFVKKLEERARELLESGNILPRLTLSPAKQGVRKWMDENKAVETMQALSINPYTIKSPTQAYKALGLDAKDHVRELDEHITRTYCKQKIDFEG